MSPSVPHLRHVFGEQLAATELRRSQRFSAGAFPRKGHGRRQEGSGVEDHGLHQPRTEGPGWGLPLRRLP